MDSSLLKEISKDEIRLRLKKYDLWELRDIILFSHAYEHEGVPWKTLCKQENGFPQRQFHSALESMAAIKPSEHLKCVETKVDDRFAYHYVKKGTFFRWAKKNLDSNPRFDLVYSLWQKHTNTLTSPSLLTTKARVKNCADKIQIQEFIEFSKAHPNKKYHANISEIAKQVKTELNLPADIKTYRRYIERMTYAELEAAVKA